MRLDDKINEIYTDLSTNVTKIYSRNNLHLAIDLIYHSPQTFYFQKKKIDKGYPELLILGDTRCGKSETAKRLIQHYRLGARASGENTSFAGLIGGLSQIRGRWRVSWGRIPLNDKRILFIDEICSLTQEQIGAMSDVRSSGIAEINKIRIEQTHARTRLIWMSNPREKGSVSNSASGPAMIEYLIGKPEDIARFDFVLIVDKREVDADAADERRQPVVPHVYTSDLCHDLVLWAWSRTADQVRLANATVDACHDLGKLMCRKYSSDFPLVNTMEQKIKLARLATSLACRLFSTDDGHNVIVKPEHVQYVHDFLNAQYDAPHFGYDLFSKRAKASESISDKEAILNMFAQWGVMVAYQFIEAQQITSKFVEEATGLEYNEAKFNMARLMRNGCLVKRHNFYVKTSAFIDLLKNFIESPREKKPDDF